MLAEREQDIFRDYPGRADPAAVFIVAAPRTGSTVFYQALAEAFSLPVISNHANNETPEHPAVGILESHEVRLTGEARGDYGSRYGKTEGTHGLSEGSAIFTRWCGGGHPSETRSPGVLDTQAGHMRATLASVEAAAGRPLVTKNAWNCFRVADLARRFPNAGFIWLRRDVLAAAASDLSARHVVQGDVRVWNSATPADVEALRLLPPEAQVLENQFAFTRAITAASAGLAPDRFAEIWYEDFIASPDGVMQNLVAAFAPLKGLQPERLPAFRMLKSAVLSEAEWKGLAAHMAAEPARWQPLRRAPPQ
ncbi:sulfotransferase [Hyphomonas sp.]|uniref:sulfotransferase n=1 Tax=Hyphomonas sp. TaxID=87 RepID=UPI00391AD07D